MSRGCLHHHNFYPIHKNLPSQPEVLSLGCKCLIIGLLVIMLAGGRFHLQQTAAISGESAGILMVVCFEPSSVKWRPDHRLLLALIEILRLPKMSLVRFVLPWWIYFITRWSRYKGLLSECWNQLLPVLFQYVILIKVAFCNLQPGAQILESAIYLAVLAWIIFGITYHRIDQVHQA